MDGSPEKRSIGLKVLAKLKKRAFTQEQIAAAQLRVLLDEKLGRTTPDLIRRIARATAPLMPAKSAHRFRGDAENSGTVNLLDDVENVLALELVSG